MIAAFYIPEWQIPPRPPPGYTGPGDPLPRKPPSFESTLLIVATVYGAVLSAKLIEWFFQSL
jgi:hypothetical protein